MTGFIYPYERHDGLAVEIVPEYYETTPRAFRGKGLNSTQSADPFTISREYYEKDRMDEEELAQFLDRVANEPDFGILASHSSYDTLTEERIATAIEMARERNIEIVTLQEVLNTFDIVEIPKRIEKTNETNETDNTANDNDEESMGLFDRIISFFRSLFSTGN